RRHPLLLGAPLHREARSHSRRRESDRRQHHRAGDVVGGVFRVLRTRPLEDELLGAGPPAGGLRRMGRIRGDGRVTLLDERPIEDLPEPEPRRRATGILAFCTTTDHKRIGVAYMLTAFAFFIIGGAMAGVMRAQLTQPELDLVSEDTYNQLFTM